MARVLLGDVARERKEQCKADRDRYPAVGLEHLVPQEVKLTEWSEGTENTFTKMFRKGDVLFGRRRAYLKKAAVASFDGICSGDITVIQAIPHKILPELLPFVIQNETFFDFAVGGSAGSLSPRVKWEHLRNYEFELPNEEKQRELAEVLWAIYDTLEAYKKLLVKTDELVKARFVEMFGTIEKTVYEVSTVGDECELKSGTTLPADKVKTIGEFPYIKVADMNLPENETYINVALCHVSTQTAGDTYLNKGTIIFPKRGGAIGTNKKRILCVDTCVDLNIMGVRPGKRLLTEYLYAYFLNVDLANICDGSTIPQINNKNIRPLAIIIPPLEEQTQFAAFVHQTDKSKQELKQAITDLEATYKQILFDNLT